MTSYQTIGFLSLMEFCCPRYFWLSYLQLQLLAISPSHVSSYPASDRVSFSISLFQHLKVFTSCRSLSGRPGYKQLFTLRIHSSPSYVMNHKWLPLLADYICPLPNTQNVQSRCWSPQHLRGPLLEPVLYGAGCARMGYKVLLDWVGSLSGMKRNMRRCN